MALLLATAGSARAAGILIPEEKKLPPLAMLNHLVTVDVVNQVATTRVEQTFRNHTDRQLEATYLFPVPKGAAVKKFTMFVNGKEVKGELVEADKARQIYTDIVRRTQDPGLLEYLGNNLFKLRVFPIAASSDQKLTLSFQSVAPREGNLVEYIYPLKTNGKATSTLEKFSVTINLKDKNVIPSIYSPTHAINITRPNDREARVTFERDQALLDKDFQLFYTVSGKPGDVGLTAMTHRPVGSDKGYFMLLISPRVEIPKDQQVPRDMVFVLDTSGSMSENGKMEQAQKALKYCLSRLTTKDRFGLINFATSVNKYTNGLLDANPDQIAQAKKWVDGLEATGGTAIDEALKEALALRTGDSSRTFTIVFFTDGQPTIGETNPEKILKNVAARNTANTRIFTFGVGDDVNATMLDTLAEQSRAVSTYVRPAEDIEAKVSALYGKISNPVLANLKLTAGSAIRLAEVYPPQLPDLFHGGQLVVLGRYSGQGPCALTLAGTVGKDNKEFVYEVTFPEKTDDDKSFVEDIWARRKVGYLLDQIRANGEQTELVNEVKALAKKYGIATPYTSYLVVPDAPVPVARGGQGMHGGFGGGPGGMNKPAATGVPPTAPALYPLGGATSAPMKVAEFAKKAQEKEGDLEKNRGKFEDGVFSKMKEDGKGGDKRQGGDRGEAGALRAAKEQKDAFDKARAALARRLQTEVQTGKLGVDLSVQSNNLRAQDRLTQTALRQVAGRNCLEIGGVWIDEGYTAKMKMVAVRAQSAAYFRILERQPKVKEVFKLGNHLVWVTPSGTALVIDTSDGKEKMTDSEIDALFVAKK
jgi:Ca-activated chloride channel family protein